MRPVKNTIIMDSIMTEICIMKIQSRLATNTQTKLFVYGFLCPTGTPKYRFIYLVALVNTACKERATQQKYAHRVW